MLWFALILSLTGLFAAGVSFHIHQKTDRIKFLGLFLASCIFALIELVIIGSNFITETTAILIAGLIIEWGHVILIALVTSSLLLFVRESKPEFSRFPRLYALLPLFIIISYLLVYDTILLKNWLINIYQGGAALVALLMYGIYSYRESIYLTTAIGSVFFMLAFLLYLLIPGYIFIWQTFLAMAIITTFSGYLVTEKQYSD